MSFKHNLESTSGFIIAEGLISAVVIGLIVLTVISQNGLVNQSRVTSSSNSVVNSLKDKLVTALANEKTCTSNFTGISMTTTTHSQVRDSEGTAIIDLVTSYGQTIGGNVLSDNANDLVKVSSITTVLNPANSDEMNLTVAFTKKNGRAGLFSSSDKFTLPLNIIKNAVTGKLVYCFSDATLSIATAIRLSCKGNSAYYNEVANPPYGQCEHSVQPTIPACPSGQFMNVIGINLSGLSNAADKSINIHQLEYRCRSLESTCPTNMVITNTNANGTVTCGYPLPNCSAGQMMVMSSGGNYTCLNSDVGCTGLYAVKSIQTNGTFDCQQFYPPQTCAGFVTAISPGSISCSSNVTAMTCPFGQYISSVDANGTPVCTPWVVLPQACSAGYGATGIDSNGLITCQPMDKRTSCAGSTGGRTFRECLAAGGVINDRYVPGSTNAYCTFNIAATTSPSCPAGWTPCSNLRYTTNNSCDDSNSACAYSVRPTQTAPGSYAFYAHNPNTTTCYTWLRNSGPWVMSCTPVAQPTTTAYTIQLGCY